MKRWYEGNLKDSSDKNSTRLATSKISGKDDITYAKDDTNLGKDYNINFWRQAVALGISPDSHSMVIKFTIGLHA